MNDQRILMLRALLFDWLGHGLIVVLILSFPVWTGIDLGVVSLQGQGPWLVFVFLLYPLLGWLFGSYTVLRWRRLTLLVLLQRLLITAVVTLMVVAIARWLINRVTQFGWFTVGFSCCGLWRSPYGRWLYASGSVGVFSCLNLRGFCCSPNLRSWSRCCVSGGGCLSANVCVR